MPKHSSVRLTKRQTDNCRKSIQVTQIFNRLSSHLDGEIELSTTQIAAARILLDKSVASLSATELSSDPENPVSFSWSK